MRRSDFPLYLVSRFAAGAAMTMLRAAVAWQVFDLTQSAFHLGLIGLVQFLPQLGLTLVAGAVADTYERRRVMLIAQSVALVGGAMLAIVTLRGGVAVGSLYALVALIASAGAFDNPARAAFLPTLVTPTFFPRAVTINSTNQALAFVSGPALCGIVIAGADVGTVYVLYVALLAVSLICVACIRPRPVVGERSTISVHAIREGLRFVRRQPVLLGCMTLDMFAVIFGGATALLPIYANEILKVGPRGYGLLSSSLGPSGERVERCSSPSACMAWRPSSLAFHGASPSRCSST